MKKSEFIEQVAEKAEMSRAAAARAVDAIFNAASGTISEAVRAGRHVAIPGFGRFRPKTRPARRGRNPKTGAEIDIPEKTVLSFNASKGMQDAMTGEGGTRRAGGGARKSAASGGAKKSGGAAKTASRGGTKTATKGASKSATKTPTKSAAKSPAKSAAKSAGGGAGRGGTKTAARGGAKQGAGGAKAGGKGAGARS